MVVAFKVKGNTTRLEDHIGSSATQAPVSRLGVNRTVSCILSAIYAMTQPFLISNGIGPEDHSLCHMSYVRVRVSLKYN